MLTEKNGERKPLVFDYGDKLDREFIPVLAKFMLEDIDAKDSSVR